MLPIPSIELITQVQATYSTEFLTDIFRTIELTDPSEQDAFKRIVTFSSAGYLEFLNNNPNRLRPFKQEELLEKYKDALKTVKGLYQEITSDTPTRVKFHDALQEEYNQQSPLMQEMLSPYQDSNSYNETIFHNFLDLLMEVCEMAKTRNIGNDKSIVSNDALAWWVAMIGIGWPKTAVEFHLGHFSQDVQTYKTPAFSSLVKLMKKIDSVTEQNIATAMKKAVIKGKVQNPTELLIK